MPRDSSSLFSCRSQTTDSDQVIALDGPLNAETASQAYELINLEIKGRPAKSIRLNLSGLSVLDDFGVAILAGLNRRLQSKNRSLYLEDVPQAVRTTLDYYHFDKVSQKQPVKRRRQLPNMFVAIGEACFKHGRDFMYMHSFLGSSILCLLRVIKSPRSLRWDDMLAYMQRTGVDALPIVGLISFLLGLIMAFMSSVQLQQFGANIYVASLVSLAMTRELGPIMTCIIIAGRSGSAYAAEIGSMKISEEVDALFTMGFDPHLFLVTPKLVATFLVVPILTLFSDLFAILGGMLIGISMLDLTINSYINQTIATLDLFDVFWGVGKSAVFALLISWIGCFRGFQVRGGATAVGRATTSAVVSAIFHIILADSLFAIILRYWD
jgi:phospholipid/cholesterol/gamma-HCH transport system permease protein